MYIYIYKHTLIVLVPEMVGELLNLQRHEHDPGRIRAVMFIMLFAVTSTEIGERGGIF